MGDGLFRHRFLSSSGLRPHHVCGEPITTSVQGEEGCEGIYRERVKNGGYRGLPVFVGGGMGMACVGPQDGATAPHEA
jgi:hypothetical protein